MRQCASVLYPYAATAATVAVAIDRTRVREGGPVELFSFFTTYYATGPVDTPQPMRTSRTRLQSLYIMPPTTVAIINYDGPIFGEYSHQITSTTPMIIILISLLLIIFIL